MDTVEVGLQEEILSQEGSTGDSQAQDKTRKGKTVAKKKTPDPCLCCGENCGKGQASVKCVMCELWAHKICIRMPDATYKQLEQMFKETGMAYWVCRPCQNFVQRVKHRFAENDKRHQETEKKVETNTRSLDGHEKEIEDMKQAMKQMAEKMEREKEERDGMVCEEIQEMEARRRNLVIHGLQEAPEAIRVNRERMEWDKNLCGELFQVMGARVKKEELRFCRRIGERGNMPRPVVIGVEEDREKAHLLKMARELKGTKYENVSIVPDLTRKQRQQEARLREEAESRNGRLTEEDRRNNLKWIVVGMRGEKRLIKGVERDRETFSRTTRSVPFVPQPRGGGGGSHAGARNNPGGQGMSMWNECNGGNRSDGYGNNNGNRGQGIYGNGCGGNNGFGGNSNGLSRGRDSYNGDRGGRVSYPAGDNSGGGVGRGNGGVGSGGRGVESGGGGVGRGGWGNNVGNYGECSGNGNNGNYGVNNGQGTGNGYGNGNPGNGNGINNGYGDNGERLRGGWHQENQMAGEQDRPVMMEREYNNGNMNGRVDEVGRTRLGSKRGRGEDSGTEEEMNPANRYR